MKLDVKFVSENQIIDSKFSQINNISDGGYERGYAEGEREGYTNGYSEGETKGFNKGKSEGIEEGYIEGKADGITEGIEQGYTNGYNDGNILYYALKTDSMFESVEFPENYNMVVRMKNVPNSWYRAFAVTKNLKSVKIITEDKEKSMNFNQTFRDCRDVEIIDLTDCSRKISNAPYMLFGAYNVKSILGALDLSECNSNGLNYAFFTGVLQDVEIVPNTINANIRFTSGSLSAASMESIVNGLADMTESEPKTLTLNREGTSLTEDQKTRISAKNWTLAY